MVFFDDILIYSPDFKTHIEHLRVTLDLLRRNKLYAKLSKCTFGVKEVEYLGHIISDKGVATDPAKISAMKNWPRPQTI